MKVDNKDAHDPINNYNVGIATFYMEKRLHYFWVLKEQGLMSNGKHVYKVLFHPSDSPLEVLSRLGMQVAYCASYCFFGIKVGDSLTCCSKWIPVLGSRLVLTWRVGARVFHRLCPECFQLHATWECNFTSWYFEVLSASVNFANLPVVS